MNKCEKLEELKEKLMEILKEKEKLKDEFYNTKANYFQFRLIDIIVTILLIAVVVFLNTTVINFVINNPQYMPNMQLLGTFDFISGVIISLSVFGQSIDTNRYLKARKNYRDKLDSLEKLEENHKEQIKILEKEVEKMNGIISSNDTRIEKLENLKRELEYLKTEEVEKNKEKSLKIK